MKHDPQSFAKPRPAGNAARAYGGAA